MPEDGAETDKNGCVVFSVTLTDHAGNVGEAVTRQINAEGTANCPETRVELDLSPPVFLWLQTRTITRGDMTFDVALNEPAEVFFVAVPEGSNEPTPAEVAAGSGAAGAAASSAGSIAYEGSDVPSPAAAGGGIGLVELTVPDLDQGFRYDLYFTAVDRFGLRETEARSRRLASLGVWTPADGVRVKEGDGADVIVLELTQPPTADVTVELGTTLPGHEGQLLFALEANTLVYADALAVTFPRAAWSEPIEVKVKRKGAHGHTYWIDNPAVLSDVILILRDDLPPGRDRGRPLIRAESGMWEIYDGYPYAGPHAEHAER